MGDRTMDGDPIRLEADSKKRKNTAPSGTQPKRLKPVQPDPPVIAKLKQYEKYDDSACRLNEGGMSRWIDFIKEWKPKFNLSTDAPLNIGLSPHTWMSLYWKSMEIALAVSTHPHIVSLLAQSAKRLIRNDLFPFVSGNHRRTKRMNYGQTPPQTMGTATPPK